MLAIPDAESMPSRLPLKIYYCSLLKCSRIIIALEAIYLTLVLKMIPFFPHLYCLHHPAPWHSKVKIITVQWQFEAFVHPSHRDEISFLFRVAVFSTTKTRRFWFGWTKRIICEWFQCRRVVTLEKCLTGLFEPLKYVYFRFLSSFPLANHFRCFWGYFPIKQLVNVRYVALRSEFLFLSLYLTH